MNDPRFSVVIPVYQSEATLPELTERLAAVFARLDSSYEVILVEDGGADGSWDCLQSLRRADRRLRIIRLMRNYGQHNAIMCGLAHVRGRYVITLDDDLQNPPEEIPKLLEAIETTGSDVVFGVPERRRHSWWRNCGARLFHRIMAHTFGLPHSRYLSNVIIMKRAVAEQLSRFPTPHPLVALLVLQVTDRIGNVAIQHHRRSRGRTTYSPRKLLRHFTHGILYHSFLPLKGIFLLGLGSFCLSMLLGILYLVMYLAGLITVSGWTTIVLLILLFSGIIMVSLGVIGEYLFRIIQEVYRTPQYLIREKEIE
ncbi:MAG: glycosyltransferase family 2 protein [Sedimentisphaerales bacterium]|nr:glycosyltransferase family 2 protein [Sedimentisphaerales bacterium]